jgi:hypothetical protein
MQNVLVGGVIVKDGPLILSNAAIALPTNSVGDSQVSAASPLAVDKTIHQINAVYKQAHGAVVADDTGSLIHIAGGTGTIVGINAAVRVIPIGAATVTVDLKKNGTTVLNAVITLDSGNVAYTAEVGSILTAGYVAGDFFEVVVDATVGGGTLPQGLGVEVVFREAYQP